MALTDKSERQLQDLAASVGLDPSLETEFLADDLAGPAIEIDLETGLEVEPDIEIMEMPDGSAVVDLSGEGPSMGDALPQEHHANLAKYIDEQTLMEAGLSLIQEVEEDLTSRKDWEHTLKEALKTLGLKMEDKDKPWKGACSVIHPLLSESIVRFQSQTIGDILPPGGPVKGSVVGRVTPEKVDKAKRVERHMNYVLMTEMKEYRPETERLLFGLALNGSAFRKYFKSPITGKPKSIYIQADNVIIHYDASDIRDADRVTHRMYLSDYIVKRYQESGFYRSLVLQDPLGEKSEVQQAIDELTGMQPLTQNHAKREVWEIQCYYDFGEGTRPYIVTVDKTQQVVLAVYRDWDESDETYDRIPHMVHYEFIPGLGVYGFGYAHLVGNTAKGVTSILQQLVDAGTLNNVPGGLKSKNARMTNDSGPVLPGEWRDVDVPSQKLADHFMPLPTKEPSPTLYQLMQGMIEDGRRLASTADIKLQDMNQQTPVGTTLAILERSLKMQTAIQQRVHAGLKEEFAILARLIAETTPEYPFEVEEGEEIAVEDYSDEVDVVPVSDPNASTLSHRVMQYQAALTAAQQTPNVYDMAFLNRQFIEAIGMQNPEKIVPMEEEVEGKDPISENAEFLNQGRVGAKEYQDHESHIKVHMALKMDPEIQQMTQNSPMGGQIMAAIDAHIREHMAFKMKQEMEEAIGSPLPALGQAMPADVEQRIARLAADAADQITGRKQAMAQAAKNAEQSQDPVIQMKMQELQLRAQEIQQKAQQAQLDAQQKAQKDALDLMLKQAQSKQDADLEQQRLDLQRQEMVLDAMASLYDMEERQALEGARLGVQIGQAAATANTPSTQRQGGSGE